MIYPDQKTLIVSLGLGFIVGNILALALYGEEYLSQIPLVTGISAIYIAGALLLPRFLNK